MNKQHIVITEYGFIAPLTNKTEQNECIFHENKHLNYFISEDIFIKIKNWTNNYNQNHNTVIFKIESKNIYKKKMIYESVLVAQNYVGTIQFDNIVIDIIPKIFYKENEDYSKVLDNSNILLVKMLKTTTNYYEHDLNIDLSKADIPILEIFISSFLNEVEKLVKRGIISGYVEEEYNSQYFKGKVLWQQHFTKNLTDKTNFYIRTASFTKNRIENKIIKTTLIFLSKISKNFENLKRIQEYRFIFGDIDEIFDYKNSFDKIEQSRNLKYYETVLKWCDIFLNDKHNPFGSGDDYNTYSFLFDMEKIFEEYVAYVLSTKYKQNIKTQVSEKYLFKSNEFKMIPDIKADNYIADTKWKILEKEKDISQSDLYQMYAYLNAYKCSKVYLIYPKTENEFTCKFINNKYFDGKELVITFFDIEEDVWIYDNDSDCEKNGGENSALPNWGG